MAAQGGRFDEATVDDIGKLIENSKCQNTTKQTDKWMRAYLSWAGLRNKSTEIHKLPPLELDEILQLFYAELKKKKGDDYEPNSLNSMQSSLDRHLRDNGYLLSIMRDREFISSRSVLEGKARFIRQNGKGQRPNRAHSLTKEEEKVLWDCGQLGTKSPRALINTVWWLVVQHFGLRGRENHHRMKLEHFSFKVGEKGKRYVTFDEGISKTFQSGLHEKHRMEKPFMFENKLCRRCPYEIFKTYISKRPVEMRSSGPLYLAVIENPSTDVWFKKSPMGVNTIHNIVKNMVDNSPLANIINKKITNHSARKTLVKKLKSANVPKCDIIAITGHTTEAGLDDYDSGNENHQEALSHKIDLDIGSPERSNDMTQSTSTQNKQQSYSFGVVPKDNPIIPNPSFSFFPYFNPFAMNPACGVNNQQQHLDQHLTNPNPFAFFPYQQYLQQQQQVQPVHNHFHLSNCTDVKISGFPQHQLSDNVSSPPAPKKRKRYVIEDSDSSQEQ